VFKCIKCKKTQNDYSRRYNPRTNNNKPERKKIIPDFMATIGFEWELSTSELAEDMERIKEYLD
jgi:hypothetical protein